MKALLGFLTFITCISFACISSANTGVFFGSGNQIIPIKNDQIQLVKENVAIRLSIEEGNGRFGVPFIPWANVSATFYLKNTTQTDVSLQVGFPFTDLQGFGNEKEVLENLKFKVVSDGHAVKTELKEGLIEKRFDPRGLFKKVFSWKEQFKPDQQKKVVVTYKMLMAVASANSNFWNLLDQQRKIFREIDKLIPALIYHFGYITKTAYTWTGAIEEAVFKVDCSAVYREVEQHDFVKTLYKKDPSFTRPIFLELVSPNTAKKSNGAYQWKFTGKVPGDGVSIGFIVLFLPSLPKELNRFVASAIKQSGSIDPELTKSVIKAYYQILAYGKQPSDSLLKEYFRDVKLFAMPRSYIFKGDEKSIKEIANHFERLTNE